MIALRKTAAAFGAELVLLDEPDEAQPGQVIVDVAAAGICGSDIHAYEWTSGYEFMADVMPVTIGHEFSGIVRAIGEGVSGLRKGSRIVCWPTVTCGSCEACSAGRPQDCGNRSIIGLHRDGGFAGRVMVPAENCSTVPDHLSLETAALTEPLSISVNAVNIADIKEGDRVIVLGPGPIGLGAAWVAQQRGAHVLLAGFNDDARLALAREMGIAQTADLSGESLADAVKRVFDGAVDRVIEATGIAASVIDGLAVLRSSGIVVVAGIHSTPLQLDLTRFVREKKQLRAAHDTTPTAISEAIRLLSENTDILSRMITHRRPLSAAIEAFELARSRQAVKVMLLPDNQEANL